MAGGFDEKAGGAQMGVMQGPMVSKHCADVVQEGRPLLVESVACPLIVGRFIFAATMWSESQTSTQ